MGQVRDLSALVVRRPIGVGRAVVVVARLATHVGVVACVVVGAGHAHADLGQGIGRHALGGTRQGVGGGQTARETQDAGEAGGGDLGFGEHGLRSGDGLGSGRGADRLDYGFHRHRLSVQSATRGKSSGLKEGGDLAKAVGGVLGVEGA